MPCTLAHHQQILAEGRHVADGVAAEFAFEPLAETGSFALLLDSPDGLHGCAVTALRVAGAGLTIDGVPQAGALDLELKTGAPAPTAVAPEPQPEPGAGAEG